ncbi:MAG: sterol desaturase family protein [Pseudomonadota bacterium]
MYAERSPVWLAVMLALVLAEAGWRLYSGRGYDFRATLATLGLVLGGVVLARLHAVTLTPIFESVSAFAPWQLDIASWESWIVGFFAVEFAYYWFHRASHRVRWLWASHAVHHSAEEMTLLASVRLGWTNLLSAGWVVYLPLVLIGFPPAMVFLLLAFNLRYQFFLHTEAVGRLGPIEWVFNTPAHHRVHHASNARYLDCNYGGVLIIFDRWFGSFREECPEEPIIYGLAHRQPSYNPLVIAFREWGLMMRDAWRAHGVRARVQKLAGPPADE